MLCRIGSTNSSANSSSSNRLPMSFRGRKRAKVRILRTKSLPSGLHLVCTVAASLITRPLIFSARRGRLLLEANRLRVMHLFLKLFHTFFRTVVLYSSVLLMMRIMGKREVGQLSLFDLVVAI